MKGELIRVWTEDNIELQGFFASPKDRIGEVTILHIHGLAGNFYENRFLDYITKMLIRKKINFLTFNNRGHDYIADFLCKEEGKKNMTYRQIGGAYEIFKECIMDINAWIKFLKSRGSNKIILQGHSHGAIKAVYYLSEIESPCIIGLILLSPSDDIGLQRSDLGKKFDEALELARKLNINGDRKKLMPNGYFEYPISAKTYLDSFDKNSTLGIFNLSKTDREGFPELEKIKVPALTIVGTINEAFIGESQQFLYDLKTLIRNTESFTGYILEGAPHIYLGYEKELSQKIGQWLNGQIS